MSQSPQAIVVRSLESLAGIEIGELSARFDIGASGKPFHVEAIRRALLASDAAEVATQLYRRRQLKVARIKPSGDPAELMLFPNIRPFDFVEEEWIRSILDGLLIVGGSEARAEQPAALHLVRSTRPSARFSRDTSTRISVMRVTLE